MNSVNRMTLVCLAVAWLGSGAASAAAQTREDEEAIRRLIVDHGAASRRGDLVAMIDVYHRDVWFVGRDGTPVSRERLQAMQREWASVGVYHRHPEESIEIRFVRPDVAIAHVDTYSYTSDPGRTSLHNQLVTVWTKEEGAWRVIYQRIAARGEPNAAH